MIVVKVMGGLGNQMFQIAYARALALQTGEKIYLDISGYQRYKIREFSLQNLKIYSSNILEMEYSIPFGKKILIKATQKSYHIYQKVMKSFFWYENFGKHLFMILPKIGLYYNFDRFYYCVDVNSRNDKYLYGYFQSEKYFEKYKHQIIEELKVKTLPNLEEEKALKRIRSCNSVALSMRMGDDYANSKSLNVCDENYYYKAMDYIYERNKDVVFFVFSDDIDKVKSKFKFNYPIHFLEGFKDYQSLRLLYSCKHFIISNSSFSWWGAYLSENKGKIIITPNRWYNDTRQKVDIYTKNMISI